MGSTTGRVVAARAFMVDAAPLSAWASRRFDVATCEDGVEPGSTEGVAVLSGGGAAGGTTGSTTGGAGEGARGGGGVEGGAALSTTYGTSSAPADRLARAPLFPS